MKLFRKFISPCFLGLLLLSAIGPVVFMTGCVQESKSVRAEAVPNDGAVDAVHTEREVVGETHRESPSILGATFNVIGEVVAFPFKLIGEMLRLIF